MAALREALADEMAMHAAHYQGGCLCGAWTEGTWAEHLADAALAVIIRRWTA